MRSAMLILSLGISTATLCIPTAAFAADDDGDGYSTDDGDCDDDDPTAYPGAFEDCDGVDNNCDGEIDEGCTDQTQTDTDSDGLSDQTEGDLDTDDDGVPDFQDEDDDGDGVPTLVERILGMNPYSQDTDADNVPDDVELGDPVSPNDTDGNGAIDAIDPDDDGDGVLTINEDADGDGDPRNDDTDGDGIPDYLDPSEPQDGSESQYDGTNGTAEDLDDPTVDNGLDSIDSDDEAPPQDADGDGYLRSEDCDDDNPEAHPDAVELCNGRDDNCDGVIDGDGCEEPVSTFSCRGTGGTFTGLMLLPLLGLRRRNSG